jgi:hypothetical protein
MHRFLLVAVLFLVACQPLPHPFADDRPPPNSPILAPPDSVGIVVLPVSGSPADAALEMAPSMAEALQSVDVPASTHAHNRASYRLTGVAQEDPLSRKVTVNWELDGPTGTLVGKVATTAADLDNSQKLAEAVARDAAPAIAKLIAGNAPLPASLPDPVVGFRGVTGSPGDGAHALERAIRDALARSHLALAAGADASRLADLSATVEVAKPDAGKQKVKIVWHVTRLDGSEVGQVKQENAVPAGTLDGPWGDVAYAVAQAAGPGIASIVGKVTATPQGQPSPPSAR